MTKKSPIPGRLAGSIILKLTPEASSVKEVTGVFRDTVVVLSTAVISAMVLFIGLLSSRTARYFPVCPATKVAEAV